MEKRKDKVKIEKVSYTKKQERKGGVKTRESEG